MDGGARGQSGPRAVQTIAGANWAAGAFRASSGRAVDGAVGRFRAILQSGTDKPFDPLVDAFVAHYQFETIHPFMDGNGRVGRLLLSIMIMEWCGLSDQWLYMSPYFEVTFPRNGGYRNKRD